MGISKVLKSGLILLALVVAAGAYAAPWFANGPKRDVVTLVMAGNYKSPRLMAELILYEGLAALALSDREHASARFHKLIACCCRRRRAKTRKSSMFRPRGRRMKFPKRACSSSSSS